MAQLNNAAHIIISDKIAKLSDFLSSLQSPHVIVLIVLKAWMYAEEHMEDWIKEGGEDLAEAKMHEFVDELWNQSIDEVPEDARRFLEIIVN